MTSDFFSFFYLGAAFAAVGASNEIHVPAAVLVSAAIPALESLQQKSERERKIERSDFCRRRRGKKGERR